MYAGRVVERAATRDLFYDPQMPYTWGLLGSIPRLDRPRPERLHSIKGAPPSVINVPPGCKFRPRCPHAFEKCMEEPALENRVETPGHLDRCWLDVDVQALACATRRSPARRRKPREHERRRAADRGQARQEVLPDPEGPAAARGRARARRRRRQLRGARGRDARPRRRVGLRQVDARPHDRPPARADRRARSSSRASRSRSSARGSCGRCAGRCRWSSRIPTRRLNPRKRVGSIIGDPLKIHGLGDKRERKAQVEAAARDRRPLAGALQPLPARVLGRPAAADRDRAGARAAAEARSSPTSRSRRSTSRSSRRC